MSLAKSYFTIFGYQITIIWLHHSAHLGNACGNTHDEYFVCTQLRVFKFSGNYLCTCGIFKRNQQDQNTWLRFMTFALINLLSVGNGIFSGTYYYLILLRLELLARPRTILKKLYGQKEQILQRKLQCLSRVKILDSIMISG